MAWNWPTERIDEGWRTLLLSQHHDCWIVPYNRLQGKKTWAETVTDWTGVTNQNSRQIIDNALSLLKEKEGESTVYVYNTLATDRRIGGGGSSRLMEKLGLGGS